MTEQQELATRLICEYMGLYIRKPCVHTGDVNVEISDPEIYELMGNDGYGYSQNPKTPKTETKFGSDKKYRTCVNWKNIKKLKFHKSFDWLMIVIKKICQENGDIICLSYNIDELFTVVTSWLQFQWKPNTKK